MTYGRTARPRKWLAVVLLLFAAAMFGFGYAMIPVYDVLCAVAGINGKSGTVPDAEIAYRTDSAREIGVEAVVSVNNAENLAFQAQTPKLRMHPGEYRTLHFQGTNRSGHDLLFRTMPSITPGVTAEFFKKTECFCFSEQTLKAGESRIFSVRFAIDPEIPARYKVMTLSLSIYDITGKTVTQNSK